MDRSIEVIVTSPAGDVSPSVKTVDVAVGGKGAFSPRAAVLPDEALVVAADGVRSAGGGVRGGAGAVQNAVVSDHAVGSTAATSNTNGRPASVG
jgi:hypothetical protein